MYGAEQNVNHTLKKSNNKTTKNPKKTSKYIIILLT